MTVSNAGEAGAVQINQQEMGKSAQKETPPSIRVAKAIKQSLRPLPDAQTNPTPAQERERANLEADQRRVRDVLAYTAGWGENTPLQPSEIHSREGNPAAGINVIYKVLRTDERGDMVVEAPDGSEKVLSRVALLRESIANLPRDPATNQIDQARLEKIIPDKAQRDFLLAHCEAQKPGAPDIAEVQEKKLILEAAKSTGRVIVAEQIVEVAAAMGAMSEEDRKAILEPSADPAVAKPTLTAQGEQVKKFFEDNPVPSQEQVKKLFKDLDIPFNSAELESKINRNQASIANQRKMVRMLAAGNDPTKALQLEEETNILEKRTRDMDSMRNQLNEYSGSKWDAVDAMYDVVESGALPDPKALPQLMKDFQSGNTDAVLDNIIGTDNVISHEQAVRKAEMKKNAKRLLIQGGSAIIGLNAVMLFLAMRKKEERG